MTQFDDGYSMPDGETGATQTVSLWPPGNYEGSYVRHSSAPSATKGTPGIAIVFLVNGREVTIDCWITEKTLEGMTGQQLESLGWNGEYVDAEFAPPESVKLWMKHEEYKGKMKEKWNISTVGKADPNAVAATLRACDLWKARKSSPATVPTARPPVPARPAPKPAAAAPAKPSAAPPKPAPAKPTLSLEVAARKAEVDRLVSITKDQDSAWAVWTYCKCEDADAFWREVEKFGEAEKLTVQQWKDVAAAAPPF